MTFGLKSDFLQVMVERGCHNVSLASGVISACIGYDAAAESEETANRGFDSGAPLPPDMPAATLKVSVGETRRVLVGAGRSGETVA